jgi:hypothetical protein
MKNNYIKLSLFCLVFMGVSSSLLAQKAIHPVSQFDADQLGIGSKSRAKSLNKSTTCQDTLRYSEMKETVFGSDTYYFTDLYQQSNEAISMTFLASNNTNMTGIEIFARNSIYSNLANVVVQCGVYSVNATGDPLNLIGSGTINLSTNTFERHIINFPIPITVTGNYAIVIKPISVNGIVDVLTNDAAINPSYDEILARFKSDYFASSNGNWITMPSFSEFVVAPANFEPLVAPIISYTLNTTAFAAPLTSCIGTPVNFSQTTTPAGIEGNRFYNWWSFINHFNSNAIDSTYNWYLGNGIPELQSFGTSASNSYNLPGQYPIKVLNYGGFWSYCNDSSTVQITISQPVVNGGVDIVACEGESITLMATGADSYDWTNNVQNGQSFTVTTIGLSTYQVTGTDVNGCQDIDSVQVIVNGTSASTLTETAIDAFTLNGQTYTQSGTYSQVIPNSAGCDSTITLNLTLNFTGIQEMQDFAVSIYPNPTHELLFINSEIELLSSFELIDNQGRFVLSDALKGNQTSINLETIASGNYYLKIDERNILVKVVKQ